MTRKLSDKDCQFCAYSMGMRKSGKKSSLTSLLAYGALVSAILIANPGTAIAATKQQSNSVQGTHGESLTVSAISVSPNQAVRVTGAHFDETVGIYLAFCVIPKKGELPTPCGGGINKAGVGDASYWISSNPPPYGIGLAHEYLPGGRFSFVMHLAPQIGKFDCRKVRCAVTIRADHLRDGDRTYDMFVPISFVSKAITSPNTKKK